MEKPRIDNIGRDVAMLIMEELDADDQVMLSTLSPEMQHLYGASIPACEDRPRMGRCTLVHGKYTFTVHHSVYLTLTFATQKANFQTNSSIRLFSSNPSRYPSQGPTDSLIAPQRDSLMLSMMNSHPLK